jgi:hypothetical protein
MFILCPLSEDTQPVKTQPVQVAPPAGSFDAAGGVLGHLISVYQPKGRHPAFQWLWLLGGFLGSVGFVGYGGYLAVSSYARYGPVLAISWSGRWFIIGGIIFLICLVGGLYNFSRNQPVVRLHAQGLYIDKRNPLIMPWEQINGIASGIIVKTGWSRENRLVRYSAIIYPTKGRPVYLHGSNNGGRGIPALAELVQQVKANLYPYLHAELSRMFRSGLPLYFGPVAIDHTGFKFQHNTPLPGTRSVPWEKVKHISVQSGFFLVELTDQINRDKTGKTIRLPVAKIPNLELMLKIIDQYVQS